MYMKFAAANILLSSLLLVFYASAASSGPILTERTDLSDIESESCEEHHHQTEIINNTFSKRLLAEKGNVHELEHDRGNDELSQRSLQQDNREEADDPENRDNHDADRGQSEWDDPDSSWNHPGPEWSNDDDGWFVHISDQDGNRPPRRSELKNYSSDDVDIEENLNDGSISIDINFPGEEETDNNTTTSTSEITSITGDKNTSFKETSGMGNQGNSSVQTTDTTTQIQDQSGLEYLQNQNASNTTTRPLNLSCSNSEFYLFPNGTCLPNCPLQEYVVQTEQSTTRHQICTPCDSTCLTCEILPNKCTSCPTERPYLYSNQSCMSSCPSNTDIVTISDNIKSCIDKQQQQEGLEYPDYPDQSGQEPNSVITPLANINHIGAKMASISVACSHMLGGGSSNPIFKILLINLVQYIKYLNIEYPEKLSAVFNNQVEDIVSLDFMSYIPFINSEKILSHTAPHRFARYGVSGLFIVNFWGETLTSLTLCIIAIFISILIQKSTGHYVLALFINWAKEFLIWNFFITYLSSNLGEVVIFSFVEFQNLRLTDGYAVISLLFNIVFLGLTIFLQTYIITKLIIMRRKQKDISIEEKVSLYPNVKVIFEEGKNKHFLQEINIFIASAKMLVSGVIVGVIDAPTLQASLLLTLNMLMILYLIIYTPIRSRWKNFELILYEVLVMIADAACLSMSLKDPADQVQDSTNEDVIIVMNLMLLISLLLFQGFEIVQTVRHKIIFFMHYRASTKVYPETYLSQNKKDLVSNNMTGQKRFKWIFTFFKSKNKKKICPQTPGPEIMQTQNNIETNGEDDNTGRQQTPKNEQRPLNHGLERALSGQVIFEKTEALYPLFTEGQEQEFHTCITLTASDSSPKSDED